MRWKLGAAVVVLAAIIAGIIIVPRVSGGASAIGSSTKRVQIVLQEGNSLAAKNGEKITLTDDQGTALKPYLEAGTMMIPLRGLSEAMDLDMEWDADSSTATITQDKKIVKTTVGKKAIIAGDQTVSADVAPLAQGGVTYVPLRAMCEAMEWNLASEDGYLYVTNGGLPSDSKLKDTLKQAGELIGPSRPEILASGFVARVGSDHAMVNGQEVTLSSDDGKSIAPTTKGGITYLPLTQTIKMLGMDISGDEANGYTIKNGDDKEIKIVKNAEKKSVDLTKEGETGTDNTYALLAKNNTEYATVQLVAAATGLNVTCPDDSTVALTTMPIYGFAAQEAYLASVGKALPEKTPDAKGYIALTFDDGPTGGSDGLTVKLLDGLKERGAHATFFMCGYRIKDFHTHMERYLAEGHELGNHTMDHKNLTKLSADGIKEQLESNSELIESYTGQKPTVMRPVGGASNETVDSVCKEIGLPVIQWSVDTLDWKNRNADSVYNNIINQAKDGSIVLEHDLYETTLEGVLRAIDTLQAQGYQFVTVSELAEIKSVTLQPGQEYEDITGSSSGDSADAAA